MMDSIGTNVKRKFATVKRVFKQQGIAGACWVTFVKLIKVLPPKTAHRLLGKVIFWCGKFVEFRGNFVTYEGCVFNVDSPAVSIKAKGSLMLGIYERPMLVALVEHLDPNRSVVELGGGIGVISCLVNKMLRHPEQHIVVEADPRVIPLLAENRARNQCKFTILHRVLAYGSRLSNFYLTDAFISSGAKSHTDKIILLPTTNLNGIVQQFHFEDFSLICDIEGSEVDLINNELDCLRQWVNTIILESHSQIVGAEATEKMISNLLTAGFQLVSHRSPIIVFKRETK